MRESCWEEARVWLPVPPKTIEQDVEVISRKLPADGSVYVEKQYGNRMLYFKVWCGCEGNRAVRGWVSSDAA